MDLEALEFLLSPAGREALEALADEDLGPGSELALLSRLRRRLTAVQAGAVLQQARLRRRARDKFGPQAARMFFVPEALEQASGRLLAGQRAAWIHQQAPPGPVLELGAGIGGDTLALARLRPVIAYEKDPLRLRLLRANLEALGLEEQVEVRGADWTSESLPPAAALYADPSRRRAGRRLFRVEELDPPLSRILQLRRHSSELAIKLSPALQEADLPPGGSLEFVGLAGECREAVLWFGRLAGPPRRARVWLGERWEVLEASGEPPPLGPLEEGCLLYEPEPAVVRAGALAEMCRRLEAHLFDADIAYLVGQRLHLDPLARAFRIHEVRRFRLKDLQARLRQRGIARLEIKKRGSPLEPQELRRRLRLQPQGEEAVLFLTRRGQEPLMLLGERLS